MPYTGAGGQQFMSSALAKASMGNYTITTPTTYQSQPTWLNSLVAQSNLANVANERRSQEIRALYDEMVRRYQPGGAFEKASLAELERQKTKDIGKSTQQLISSGLYGTTVTSGLGRRWEEDVGAPARLRLEDVLMQRLSSAQQGLAGFLERQSDIGPSLSDIYGMASQYGATTPTQGTPPSTGGGEYGSSDSQLINIPAPAAGGTGATMHGTKPIPGSGYGQLYDPMKASPLPSVSKGEVEAATTADYAESFKPYYNYASTLYKMTGERLSNQAAFTKLQGLGWKG